MAIGRVQLKIVAKLHELGWLADDEFEELKAGDKVYFINRNKNVVLTVVGKRPISDGNSALKAAISAEGTIFIKVK